MEYNRYHKPTVWAGKAWACGFFYFKKLDRKIHSIESMGLVDGPGIRTVLFLQGCRLRCRYCHNPDTWQLSGEKEMDVDQIMKMLKRYRPYYGKTGGVTCSGGEPLLQAEFVTELFKACKAENISTCLDTAGYGNGSYDALLDYTDLVIFDIKHMVPENYHELTGGEITVATAFLEAVKANGVPLWIRHVVVPGLTDGESHIRQLGEMIKTIPNVQKVELLPYHTMCVEKYHALGIPYSLENVPSLEQKKLQYLQNVLTEMIA